MTTAEEKAKRRARKASAPEEEATEILKMSGLEVDGNETDVAAPPKRKSKRSANGDTEDLGASSGSVAQAIEFDSATTEPTRKRRRKDEEPAEAETPTARSDQETDGDKQTASISAKSPDDEETLTFADLGLSDAILKSVRDVGYEEPTPIQVITIPAMLTDRDVIAQAQTGSGKTAAFGLPIIDSVDGRDRHVQAIVLTPTRELAIQVAEALHKYGRHKQIETLPIYGGQPYERQFRGLQRGPQIVVGTPGRVMDHMRRGTLILDHIRYFVLDEADEMLDMGFIEDIDWILEQVPEERKTALFSATMPPRIIELAKRHLQDPQRLNVPGKAMTVPETRQTYYEVPRSRKTDALTRVLDAETPPLAMIFCRTKNGVDELGEALLARGFAAETLHGDLSQAQRDRVMRRFRTAQADILVATDVAARGLDIPDVTHVFNFDVPESAETYVHRIGRTGRMGRAGDAITLVTPKETRWLRQIERIVRARIEPRKLPTAADVADRRRDALKLQVIEILKEESNYTQYLDAVDYLSEDNDVAAVAAALLKLYADETGRGISAEQAEDDLAILTAAESGRGEPGMTRLFLNIGRNFNVRPQDIVGAIANEAGIPGRSIGAIDIFDTYSFVDVPSRHADLVIDALSRSGIKGRHVNAERAQPGAGRASREDRDYRGGDRRSSRPPRQDGYGSYPRERGDRRDGGFPRDSRSSRPRDDSGSHGYPRERRSDSQYSRPPRRDRFDRGNRRDN
jgi:ATP-dependent RNA helicase DeaD